MTCFLRISFIFLFHFSMAPAFAQPDSTVAEPPNDFRLRVRMVLEDTTGYPCPCNLGPEYKLYKFHIDKVFLGEPERNLIGVCAPEKDVLQFNPLKEAGKEYWWSVYKECVVSGLPVYRLCGKF